MTTVRIALAQQSAGSDVSDPHPRLQPNQLGDARGLLVVWMSRAGNGQYHR